MAASLNRTAIIAMAVKLVQPGKLADITDGVVRLIKDSPAYDILKESVRIELESLREGGLVCLYHGQRYILTAKGESFVDESGLSYLIEARRMYLLKETRKVRS